MIASKSNVKTGKRPVAKGFRSPADDFMEMPLDLNTHLVEHPAATFFMRASGNNMRHIGIFNDDLLIVDRSLNAKDRSIVIAILDGEFIVSRINADNGMLYLEKDHIPANEIEIWGIVMHVIKNVGA